MAIDNLHQSTYSNEVKKVHHDFDIIFKARVKEQQKGQSDLSITELRKLTTKALREILDWVFIRIKTKETEQFKVYIGNLNVLTEQYNLSVERRLNNKPNAEEVLNDDFDQTQGDL